MELPDFHLNVLEAVEELGILPAARKDALNRATSYFTDLARVDRNAIKAWALRQKGSEAHHWFVTPPSARESVELSPAQMAALQKLAPVERLTRFRELQAHQRSI